MLNYALFGIIKPREKRKHVKRENWIGTSLDDLKSMPKVIRKRIGYALFELEMGRRPPHCKTLSGFGSAKVGEIVENDRSGTYRGVYTTIIQDEIYVLHVFHMKSTSGDKTPPKDMALIRKRLKEVQDGQK